MSNAAIERPKTVMPMPFWPGAHKVIELAMAGNEVLAIGGRFPDHSEIIIEYQLHRMPGVPDELYDQVGEPPLLSVLVVDNGVGVRLVKDIGTRVSEHMAEKALREIQEHIGKDRPLGIISKGINEGDTRRRYWMKVS